MIAAKEDGVIFVICCGNSFQPNKKEISYGWALQQTLGTYFAMGQSARESFRSWLPQLVRCER